MGTGPQCVRSTAGSASSLASGFRRHRADADPCAPVPSAPPVVPRAEESWLPQGAPGAREGAQRHHRQLARRVELELAQRGVQRGARDDREPESPGPPPALQADGSGRAPPPRRGPRRSRPGPRRHRACRTRRRRRRPWASRDAAFQQPMASRAPGPAPAPFTTAPPPTASSRGHELTGTAQAAPEHSDPKEREWPFGSKPATANRRSR